MQKFKPTEGKAAMYQLVNLVEKGQLSQVFLGFFLNLETIVFSTTCSIYNTCFYTTYKHICFVIVWEYSLKSIVHHY